MKRINILQDNGMELSQEEKHLLEKLKVEMGNNFLSKEFVLDNGEVFDPKFIIGHFMNGIYDKKYTISSFIKEFELIHCNKEEKVILMEMYIKAHINKDISITGHTTDKNIKKIFDSLSTMIKEKREIITEFKNTKDKKEYLEGLSEEYFTIDFFLKILRNINNNTELLEIALKKGEFLISNDREGFSSALKIAKDNPKLLERILHKGEKLIANDDYAFTNALTYTQNNPDLLEIVLEKSKKITFYSDKSFVSALEFTQNNPKLLEIVLEKSKKLTFYNKQSFSNALIKLNNNPNLISIIIEKGKNLINNNEGAFTSALIYTKDNPELSKIILEEGKNLELTNEVVFSGLFLNLEDKPVLLEKIIEKGKHIEFYNQHALSVSLRSTRNNPELLEKIIEKGKHLISVNKKIFNQAVEYTKDYPNLAKIVLKLGNKLLTTNGLAFVSTLKHLKDKPELLKAIENLDYKLNLSFSDLFMYALSYSRDNTKLIEMIVETGKELIATNEVFFFFALVYSKKKSEQEKIIELGKELVATNKDAFKESLRLSYDNPKLLEKIIELGNNLIIFDQETFRYALMYTKENSELLKIIIHKYEQATTIDKHMVNSALEFSIEYPVLLKTILEKGHKLVSTNKELFERALESTVSYPVLRDSVFELGNNHLIKKTIREYVNPEQYKEFEKEYLKLIQKNLLIGRGGRIINLGVGYEKLSIYFKDKENWQNFIEEIIIQDTTNISQSINDIYDVYNERDYTYPNIKKKIKEGLKFYSTEELVSSLGNQLTNYTTTFTLILNEIESRLGDKNIFEYIDNNKNLNQRAKDFSIGQIIIGLSARGQVDKLLQYIGSYYYKNKIGIIINDILNYKKNNIFSRKSHIGLLLGIENLLKKDTSGFINSIIENHFNDTSTDINFKKSLIVIFDIKNNTELLRKYLGENYKKDKLYLEILGIKEQSILNPELFKEGTTKDFIYIYGGNTSGGGTEYYEKDINIYLKKYEKGYNIVGPENVDMNNFAQAEYVIIKKDGIRITFVNYEIASNLEEIMKQEQIKPLGISYRGHNFDTRNMIEETKKALTKKNKAFILDGGCNNSSYIEAYRSSGIKNQLITYDSTGRGAVTIKLMQILIEYMRENEGKDINITWQDFNEKIIGKRTDEESKYAYKYIKYPGNMIDILLKLESEKNK